MFIRPIGQQTMSSRLRRGRKNTMHNTEMIVGDITVEIMRKANLKNLYITVTPPDGKVMVKPWLQCVCK